MTHESVGRRRSFSVVVLFDLSFSFHISHFASLLAPLYRNIILFCFFGFAFFFIFFFLFSVKHKSLRIR